MDDRISAVAESQHGVVTRAQLLYAGLTRRRIEGRLASGRLLTLHHGVYLTGGLRGSLEPAHAREMAAVLACGRGAVVSHRSAARLWGMLTEREPAEDIEVTVPPRLHPRRPGIRARRSNHLPSDQTTERHGIPITSPGRTLRDLSVVIGIRELNRAAARAERSGLIRRTDLSRLVEHHRGRVGAPLLRAAIDNGNEPIFTRSEAEERFLALIQSGGLPIPETNATIRRHEVDFLWRAERLVVEVDGFGFHASRRSFENDRRRDAELAAAGMRVVRVTWRQMVEEPNTILVRVAQVLAR